jgi:hypothetical protein
VIFIFWTRSQNKKRRRKTYPLEYLEEREMDLSSCNGSKRRRVASSAAALAVLALGAGSALAISQSGEQKNLRRVGHVDLQGRASYQPNVIVYPDGRTIAFAGTHSGKKPNPLRPGSPVDFNGTMIVDITDPERPVEKFHIPVPVENGQAQMARMCLGSDRAACTGMSISCAIFREAPRSGRDTRPGT